MLGKDVPSVCGGGGYPKGEASYGCSDQQPFTIGDTMCVIAN